MSTTLHILADLQSFDIRFW